MEEEVLTTFQAAEFCKSSFMSIKRWIEAGKLSAYKTPGGHHRIPKSNLIDFMKKNNIPVIEKPKIIRKKILVVDDDNQVRESIAKSLRRKGMMYDVATAENGFEAGTLVTQFMPDAIILDIMMPRLDGFNVCKKIKENPALKSIYIIILTGFGSEENVRKAYESGVDKVLFKPIENKMLLEEINMLIF